MAYVDGDYKDPGTFKAIKKALGSAKRPANYLAIPPSLFPTVVEGLASAGIAEFATITIALREAYRRTLEIVLNRTKLVMLAYVLILAGLGGLFAYLPTGFLPDEDQGVLINLLNLPSGSTQQSTMAVAQKVAQHYISLFGNDPSMDKLREGSKRLLAFTAAHAPSNSNHPITQSPDYSIR